MKAFLYLLALVAAVSAKPAQTGLKIGFARNSGGRVINGDNADPGEFPHQISYQWGIFGILEHVCGGSIISENWVLTAGHCVTQVPEIGDHVVVAGVTTLNEQNSERQRINVVQKIVHPNFGGDVGPNDVALLQLATPLRLGNLVKTISLPTADSEPAGEAILSGWGSTSTSQNPVLPNHLQRSIIPLLSFDECNSAIQALLGPNEQNPLSEASNICTGPLTGNAGACSGDSGGPLIQDDVIVGVVSWGFIPCGSAGAPSVFTRVSSFVDFIKQHVTDLPN